MYLNIIVHGLIPLVALLYMNISVYRNLNKYRWLIKILQNKKIKLKYPLTHSKSPGGGKIQHLKNDGDYTCEDQLSYSCRYIKECKNILWICLFSICRVSQYKVDSKYLWITPRSCRKGELCISGFYPLVPWHDLMSPLIKQRLALEDCVRTEKILFHM